MLGAAHAHGEAIAHGAESRLKAPLKEQPSPARSLSSVSGARSRPLSPAVEAPLKDAGFKFDATELKEARFTATKLKEAQFTGRELPSSRGEEEAQFTARELTSSRGKKI